MRTDLKKIKKLKIIYRILKQTNMDRLLMGFAIFIAVAAGILTRIEPQMHNYGESVWYCFVTFTTVGFGDVTPQTTLGKIISVFLMLIGICVVSIFTGTMINFYGEFNRMRNNEVLNDFMDQLENLENLSKEELRAISKKVTTLRNKR